MTTSTIVAPRTLPSRSEIPVTDMLGEVVLRGRRLQADLRDVALDAQASVSIDAISQVSLTFYDPHFDLLRAGLFDTGGRCDLRTFRQEITEVDTGAAADGLGQVQLKCRSRFVGELQRRQGVKVMRRASPTDFVEAEGKAVGAKVVAQPSAQRKMVARDTRKSSDGSGAEKPSSWTTFERFARELGYLLFEAGGTIYFGKPTWLRDRDSDSIALVTWATGDDATDSLTVPAFTDVMDTEDGVSVSFTVPRSRVDEFMPGQLCRVRFPRYGDRKYLVKSLDFPVAGNGVASVSAGIPKNPKPEPTGRVGGGASATSSTNDKGEERRGSQQLGDILRRAGFSGDALDVAAGMAIAASGGLFKGSPYADATFVDASDTGERWGPRVGIFATRSVRDVKREDGIDRRRIYSQLRGDALYAARLFHDLTHGGRDLDQTELYAAGEWRQYRGKLDAHVRHYPGLPIIEHHTSSGGGGDGSPPPPTGDAGRFSALAFANIALAQAGDAYVWGAEGPDSFDCSGLVVWAAARVGVTGIPRTSAAQAAWVLHTSVASAIATRGALLFQGSPVHHVEISLGNGHTIAAVNPSYGVTIMSATGRSEAWSVAGRIRGMRY